MAPPNLIPVTGSQRTDALATVRQLKEALAAHGIVLPSLDVDTVSFTQFAGKPLIELGRCNQESAQALAAALTAQRGTER